MFFFLWALLTFTFSSFSSYILSAMGNESSNTRQQAYPAAPIIKPILKKPNVYPAKYMTEPFYYIYPVYSAEHDQFQRMIPEVCKHSCENLFLSVFRF